MKENMQNDQSNEAARLTSDMLPTIITTIASISILLGILLMIYAFVGAEPWLVGVGIYSILASPFLYALSDIVRSLRAIALNSQKS